MSKTRNAHARRAGIFARKWIIILLIGAVLILFGRFVDNKSLTQSAIVIGIGIDHNEEGYSVTIQSVSVTGSSAQGSPSQTFVTYTDKGANLTDTIEKISQKMGLIISLSHCNVVILSQSALKLDPVSLFLPLLKALSLPEQSVLLATDDVTKIISAQVATTVNAPFYFQSALFQKTDNGGISRVTAKDFLAHSLSRSGTVCLPFVTMKKMEEQPITSEQTSSDNVEFNMTENLVVKKTNSFMLDQKHSDAVDLYLAKEPKNKLLYTAPNGDTFEFRILNKKGKYKVEGMKAKSELSFELSFLEAGMNHPIDVDCTSESVRTAAAELAKELKDTIAHCFQLSKEKDADFLLLENKVYQSYGRTLPENCLKDIELEISVEMEVTQNS